MHKLVSIAVLLALAGCHSKPRDLHSLVFLIESSPANLDPRVGLDALLEDALQSADMVRRRADYIEAQQILARDLPAINLWNRDTIVVHNRRLTRVLPTPSGSYSFLEFAELAD